MLYLQYSRSSFKETAQTCPRRCNKDCEDNATKLYLNLKGYLISAGNSTPGSFYSIKFYFKQTLHAHKLYKPGKAGVFRGFFTILDA